MNRREICASFLVYVFFLLSLSKGLAQWKVARRQHQLVRFKNWELKALSGLTNISSIYEMLKPILVERKVGTPSHKKVGKYLKEKVEEYGFTVQWDNFTDITPWGNKKFHNLIATFEPQKKVHRRLVLACHYDSKHLPGQVFLGATDSAVPCALLLDLAKTLGPLLKRKINEEVTLQLIFFDGEEAFVDWSSTDSLYGARHLAKLWETSWYPTSNGSNFELSKEIERIDLLVLLDLLGASLPMIINSRELNSSIFFKELIEIESRLKKTNSLKPLPKIFHAGEIPSVIQDDHIPFWQRNVSVLHLISVPFPYVWHTPYDDESILDYDAIYNLASIIRVFVARYIGISPLPLS